MDSHVMKYISQCEYGECMYLDQGEDYRCDCNNGYLEVGNICVGECYKVSGFWSY